MRVGLVGRSINVWLVPFLFLSLSVSGCSTRGDQAAATSASHAGFPMCTTSVGITPPLSTARSEFGDVPGNPFAIVTTHDGRWSFVSLGPSIGVFSNDSFVPHLVQQLSVSGTSTGMALTADGSYLVVADGGSGATVLDSAATIAGSGNAVVGTMTDPARSGATGVAISRDDRYVFITQEKSSALDVFNLAAAIRGQDPSFVGAVPLGVAPVGVYRFPGRSMAVCHQPGRIRTRRSHQRRGPAPRRDRPGALSRRQRTRRL